MASRGVIAGFAGACIQYCTPCTPVVGQVRGGEGACPPADRLAAFVPFEKQLRRLSDARSAERGRLIEDISARHRRHATDYVQRL